MIALGSSKPLTCSCHFDVHSGAVKAPYVLQIVAMREKVSSANITEVMDWLRRTIRPNARQLELALLELSPGALVIALKELSEANAP